MYIIFPNVPPEIYTVDKICSLCIVEVKLTENIFFFLEVTLGALVELRETARTYFIDDIVELQIDSRFWKNLNTLDLNEIC